MKQLTDEVRDAMRRAFNLGQTYWRQADSESIKQQNKSDATREQFEALMEETVSALDTAHPEPVHLCGGRGYCSRMPFCGCGGPECLRERDDTKPAEAQGVFRKFVVQRVDGSDKPGGKHCGCEYFVLDVDHDPHAKAALQAYAAACAETHPQLSAELREKHGAAKQAQPEPVNQVLLKALSAMLTHSGMDEDEWSKPTFDQARAAIMLATTKTQECGMCGYVGTKTDAVGQCPRCHWDELQAQPERAPLSDDEIQTIYLRTYNEGFHGRNLEIAFARAIEAAIKQGGQHD